jgi:hypothetical protein
MVGSASNPRVTLTTDLIPLIARHLRDVQALGTVATLLLLTKEHYAIVSALLYETLSFATDDWLYTFLEYHDPSGLADPDPTARSPAASSRRLGQLNRVKHVHLDVAPSSRTASLILRLADTIPTHRIFPSAHTVSLHFNAVKTLPSRAPSSSYNTSKSALKVYESVRRLARPQQLTIIRPDLFACPAYREMHTYFLTAKSDRRAFFHSLHDHWPELDTVSWGVIHMDDAYAVLGVRNVYDIPTCDCVGNKAFDRDLFGCWLDWARVGEKPYPRARVLLRGQQDVVRGLQERLERNQGKLWAGEGLPDRAVFEIGLKVTDNDAAVEPNMANGTADPI